jgi:hypothetical protein
MNKYLHKVCFFCQIVFEIFFTKTLIINILIIIKTIKGGAECGYKQLIINYLQTLQSAFHNVDCGIKYLQIPNNQLFTTITFRNPQSPFRNPHYILR